MRSLFVCCAALAVAACNSTLPESGAEPPRGITLDSGTRVPPPIVLPAEPVDVGPPQGGTEAEQLAAETRAALGAPPAPVDVSPIGAPAPLPPAAQAPLPGAGDGSGISSEQDFGAVSSERSIEQDAERLERLRQQRSQIELDPSDISLNRPAETGPNVVQYALREARPVGNRGYSRGVFASEGRAARNCRGYLNADAAQEAFLARGGPGRDALGLDPDGDGNACGWDPAKYRSIVTGG